MKCLPAFFRPFSLCLAGLISSGVADAQNLLSNPSFELGGFVDRGDGFHILPNGSTAITGWTVINDSLAWGQYPNSAVNVHPAIPRDGTFFLDLQGDGLQNAPFGGVSQSIATTEGQKYVLKFHLGTQQDAGSPFTHGPISVTASAGATSSPFTYNPSGTGSQWQEFKLVFTAQGPSTVISIIGQSTAGGAYIGLDHTSVTAVKDPTLSIALVEGLPRLTLTGSVGSTYRIEHTDDLTTALPWTPLVDLTLATASQGHTDPVEPVSRRFYRAWLVSE